MSLGLIGAGRFVASFPRVSGDEPDLLRAAASLRGFSPRERG